MVDTMGHLALFLLVLGIVVLHTEAKDYVRACYLSNWSQYRPGDGKFFPANIEASLCTHLVYAFAKMNGNHLAMYEWNDDRLYGETQALKTKNPTLKSLLAIGGWNMASEPFTRMCSTDSGRREFASSSAEFLRKWGFDGLDMDWEYPVLRGGKPDDRINYVLMLQALMDEFEFEAAMTNSPRLLLTAAVPAGKGNIDAGFDVPEVSRLLDYIFLMSYDLNGAWNSYTGHNSPLYARSDEVGEDAQLNMNWAAHYWLAQGAPRSKLVIGLATYGRTFTLASEQFHDMYAPAISAGPSGQFTREAGFLAYYEICKKIKSGAAQTYWDSEGNVPYCVAGKEWIGYDDKHSLGIKLDWIMSEDFAGAMVWNIDLDDFNNQCGDGSYPLMNLIKSKLTGGSGGDNGGGDNGSGGGGVVQPTTANPAVPTTEKATPKPTTTVTLPTVPGFCSGKADGTYLDPESCQSFYECAGYRTYHKSCSPGLLFDGISKMCDWAHNVDCSVSHTTKALPTEPPTTLAPTTEAPTTAAPTTEAPTTIAPTSAAPTTAAPSTAAPTTEAPTTIAPTTAAPTTEAPTTAAPTTKAPTTAAPTTEAPTTEAPTTVAPPVTDTKDFCKEKAYGVYSHPSECSKFITCAPSGTIIQACQGVLMFNSVISACDWPANVHCSS